VQEGVNNNIHVVITLDIVQANIARKIRLRREIIGRFQEVRWRGKAGSRGFRKGWIEDKRDVFKRWIRDKITIW
jgi:hypothetical protein